MSPPGGLLVAGVEGLLRVEMTDVVVSDEPGCEMNDQRGLIAPPVGDDFHLACAHPGDRTELLPCDLRLGGIHDRDVQVERIRDVGEITRDLLQEIDVVEMNVDSDAPGNPVCFADLFKRITAHARFALCRKCGHGNAEHPADPREQARETRADPSQRRRDPPAQRPMHQVQMTLELRDSRVRGL